MCKYGLGKGHVMSCLGIVKLMFSLRVYFVSGAVYAEILQ